MRVPSIRRRRCRACTPPPPSTARCVIDGTLDAIDGAIVTAELQRLERLQYLADQAAGVTRSHGQRLAGALVEMAARSASTPAGAQRPRPLFTALVGDDTVTRLCELANGVVITPDTLIPHLGVADIETILFDGPLTVIAASPARTFTGRLRRAIEARDRHCQHPAGCDVPADDCDVDHIIPFALGGPTSQFNGRLECRPHNRDATKHDHGATPHPDRPVTVLDEIRARLRWRYLHTTQARRRRQRRTRRLTRTTTPGENHAQVAVAPMVSAGGELPAHDVGEDRRVGDVHLVFADHPQRRSARPLGELVDGCGDQLVRRRADGQRDVGAGQVVAARSAAG